jgi:hypothetical protein
MAYSVGNNGEWGERHKTVKPKAEAKPPRGPNRFKKTETRRFLTAVRESGLPVARVEHNTATGIITVFPGAPVEAASDENPWEQNAAHEKRTA